MKKAIALLIALVATAHAGVGGAAPDFTLKSAAGKDVSLSDFKGKVVVLEWTNNGCPFVKKHYGPGNMQKLQKEAAAKGVVWLTICSSAPGKQGNLSPEEVVAMNSSNGSAATDYLLDPDGKVGRLYEAKRTPEMYVINQKGDLVYHGAIDDKKSPDPADIAWTRPGTMTEPLPILSLCSSAPWSTYEIISISL